MVRNDERRVSLADAGITLLAREGSRGLTHRAVDEAAVVPAGTASNYFRSRDALIQALVSRVGDRLAPTAADLAARAEQRPGAGLFTDYMRDLLRRLLSDREATIALFELRLEGTRRPEVAEVLSQWRQTAYQADIEFHATAELPGGPEEIALLHYAIEGLAFDQLTGALDPEADTDAVIERLVTRLIPPR